MPVLGRALSLTVGQNGELTGVIPENVQRGQPPFMLNMAVGEGGSPMFYVQKDVRNQESEKVRGYGAGSRVLYMMNTCQRKPLPLMTPVISIWTDAENGGYPMSASLIEGAVDPILTYDPTTALYHLYYWVNAWSPPETPSQSGNPSLTEEENLFQSVIPPYPLTEDSTYREPNSEAVWPISNNFLGIRDLPDWFTTEASNLGNLGVDSFVSVYPTVKPTQERIGPFNISSFWVAPWSDGHLYRFPKDFDPLPTPSVAPPTPYGPPGSPPPPPVIPINNPNFLDNFSFATMPQQPIQQEVATALYHLRQGNPLKPTQKATLLEYELWPRRIMNLARTTRVLMHTTGHIYVLRKRDDYEVPMGASMPNTGQSTSEEPQPYLVVKSPQPVLSAPKGSNKILVGRQKWTSFIDGEDTYILAPLNYKYPAAGTIDLTAGNPQVDFQIHDPCDFLDSWRRGVCLPDATVPQFPPYLPEKSLVFPLVSPGSLVGLMSDMASWSY